jgi:hypothetical protein
LKAQIISLVIAVSLLALWFVGTRPLPESVLTGINVSRADYEVALSRWKAARISEYIITVEYEMEHRCLSSFVPCGIHTLHVTNDKVAFVSSTNQQIPEWQAKFEQWTIDALFQSVEGIVDHRETRCDNYPGPIYWKYVVEFDEQLGYPKRREVIASNDIGIEGGTFECGYSRVTKVKSLQILKRR